MAGNRISRTKLNNVIKELPLPVVEHCKRCRAIANFVVERIVVEDWFMDTKLNPDHIISAAYLHDVGKSRIPIDNIYAEHNQAESKKKIYRKHVAEGVAAVEELCSVDLETCGPRSFERYVCDAITEHHENYDGCGFPNSLHGEQISLTGRVTALVDTIDNLCFVGSTEEVNIDALVSKLAAMSGKELDPRLVDATIADRETFAGFIKYLEGQNKNKRKNDEYGMQMLFRPVRNIIENSTRGYYVEYVINDPFYGIVRPEVFLPVAESTGQTTKLTKLVIERLCLLLDRIKDKYDENLSVSINVPASCFAGKTFVNELIKIQNKYGVRKGTICLIVDEKGLSELEGVDYRMSFAILRDEGFRMALSSFADNSTLLSSLDTIEIDYLYIDGKYTKRVLSNPNTYGVASGILDIAHNLHILAIFFGVDDRKLEGALLKMRAKYACGDLYGEPMKEKELMSLLGAGGGDAK